MSDEQGVKSQPRTRSASNSSLPKASASVSDPDMFKQAVALLKRAAVNKKKVDALKSEDGEIREELAAICEAYGLKGMRHGMSGFEYHGWTTRKTLSKERLLAAGVSADTINAAYSESEPFLSSKILVFDIE